MKKKPLVLIGLSGTGKTTVSKIIGSKDKNVIDIDSAIEKKAGVSIESIFEEKGEETFRSLETEVLAESVESADIIAAGGGAILAAENRQLLREKAQVVWLTAKVETLAKQLSTSHARPLLSDSQAVVQKLKAMHRDRVAYYMLAADHVVATDGYTPQQVADIVQDLYEAQQEESTRKEVVGLADGRHYKVAVGRYASKNIVGLVPDKAKKAAIITQKGIGVEVETGKEQKVFFVEDGEKAKQLATVGELCSAFAAWGMTRNDVVVSVGGGVVTDLGGFTAACYHRGISAVHVSTTVLGQIDAAIGGKTGVNLPEGKNLVGAFWQPAGVICDIASLDTLPHREFMSGLGELAKYHFIAESMRYNKQLTREIPVLASLSLAEVVAACVRIKADVVAADEREGGLRAILNYGHTLAHALETAGSYDLRHGEAVAIGLVYAAELAFLLGRIDSARVAEHREIVEGFGLRWQLPENVSDETLVELFTRDKKALAGITFVLDSPTGIDPVVISDTAVLLEALAAMRSHA